MTFEALIKRLKDRGLQDHANALLQEVGKEFASGSSAVTKKAKEVAAKSNLARMVSAFENGELVPVTPTGVKYELAREVAEALRTGSGVPRLRSVPEPEPEPEAPDDAIERVLTEGVKVRLEYDEGMFSARAGDTVADGKTWNAALAALAAKLGPKEPGLRPLKEETGGEYSYRGRGRKR